jgi:protein TonB
VAALELVVKPAAHERRFGAALAASVLIHAVAMMLSPSTPKAPAFNAPMPLRVELALESALPAPEPVRSVTRPAPVKRARPKKQPVPAVQPAAQPLRPVETLESAQTTDAAPATKEEPAAPPPAAASLQSAPETVSLLAPAPLRLAPSAEALSDYTRSLSNALNRYKEYPRIAELRGWEGSVTMRLRVAPSGRLIDAQVYKSSGFAVLDQQAVAMVSKAGVLPVPPEGLDSAEVPVLVPINFRLER